MIGMIGYAVLGEGGPEAMLTERENALIEQLVQLVLDRHSRLLARHEGARCRGRRPPRMPSITEVIGIVEGRLRADPDNDGGALDVVDERGARPVARAPGAPGRDGGVGRREQVAEMDPVTSDDRAELFRRHLLDDRFATAHWVMNHDLGELRLYLDTMERFIQESEAREVASLEPHADRYEDFWTDHYPVEWQQVMGAYLRRSFVVALFSVVERHLPRVTDAAGLLVRAPIKADQLKGKLLRQSELFLSKFVKFQVPAPKDWEIVNDLYAVRNSVAHGPGQVPFSVIETPEPSGLVRLEQGKPVGKGKRVVELAKRAPGLKIGHLGYIELEPEFPAWALDRVDKFFESLFGELAALCDRAKQFEASR